ncbi:hypothetical protein BGX21_011192 [Mortierella sp. AD011]|nr:hypothetical protein BGX20_010946 [Mortierella sp. AD010]KAF9391722.1 hypothetical protein BGX21_011192 [Mortierella sp. AD011]
MPEINEISGKKAVDTSLGDSQSSRGSTIVNDWTGEQQQQQQQQSHLESKNKRPNSLRRSNGAIGSQVDVEKAESWTSNLENKPNQPSIIDAVAVDEDPVVMESGARGILVVLGGFLLIFAIIGYVSIYGLFQSQYVNIYGPRGHTQSAISYIGSLASGFQFFFTIFVGPIMNKFGHKIILWAGCIIGTLALLCSSWCTELWQLYLAQGVMFGIGASFINLAATAIPPLWYDVHRGLAMGICFCGAGIGGLVLGFVIPALINKVDVWWTLRIYALIYLVLTGFGALVMRAPRQLSGPPVPPREDVFRISIMKNPRFVLWFIVAAFFGFAYVIPFTYMPSYAQDVVGLDANVQGGHLLSVMSAANAVGRIVVGFAGDRLGAYPVALFSFLVAPLSCLFWMFAHSQGMLIAFSIIYGFFCGAWFTLVASITSKLVDLEHLGSGLTLVFLINTPGNMFTLPIAGKIMDNSGYKSMIGFNMAMWFCTALFMFILVFWDLIRDHVRKTSSKQ